MHTVTEMLEAWRRGDEHAQEVLANAVYDDLKRRAAAQLRGRAGDTLQPAALVNEAWIRLVPQRDVDWQNRSHFFGVAALQMRRVLLDGVRARAAAKRGGGAVRVTLTSRLGEPTDSGVDLLALDAALTELSELDPVVAQVVELRFFGGLTIDQTAEAIGSSAGTVKRHWAFARTWLFRKLA